MKAESVTMLLADAMDMGETVRFAESIYVKSFAASHSESNPKRDRVYARSGRMQPGQEPLSRKMPSGRPLTRFMPRRTAYLHWIRFSIDAAVLAGPCIWALREVLSSSVLTDGDYNDTAAADCYL